MDHGEALSSRAARITFRPLTWDDLPAMGRWLSEPGVDAWWREADLGREAISRKYRPLIEGEEPTRGFVIIIDNMPVGYIQAYRLGDHPDYARQIPVDPAAVATDLFIGEPGWRRRGWGTAVLRTFLERIVFGEMAATVAMIAPEPANARAIRTYERAGFRWVATVPVVSEKEPLDTGDEYVMLLSRPEWKGQVARWRES